MHYSTYSPSYQSVSYSTQSIDRVVESLQAPEPIKFYSHQVKYVQDNYHIPQPKYEIIEPFLNDHRPLTQFINTEDQIRDYIIETFRLLMNQSFPKDIVVKVCDNELMRNIQRQNGMVHDNTLGFAVNKPGIRQIFVKQNNLDRLMLVIGHELGHVLSPRLKLPIDEEAKAFSFQHAWAETIREHDIAGLSTSIKPIIDPAKNGIHDEALDFVIRKLKSLTPMELFRRISKNLESILYTG